MCSNPKEAEFEIIGNGLFLLSFMFTTFTTCIYGNDNTSSMSGSEAIYTTTVSTPALLFVRSFFHRFYYLYLLLTWPYNTMTTATHQHTTTLFRDLTGSFLHLLSASFCHSSPSLFTFWNLYHPIKCIRISLYLVCGLITLVMVPFDESFVNVFASFRIYSSQELFPSI